MNTASNSRQSGLPGTLPFPGPKSTVSDVQTTPESIALTALAIKQGHSIRRCRHCGGPEALSKRRQASLCFRCGHRETDYVPFAVDNPELQLKAMNGRLTVADVINEPIARRARATVRRCGLCEKPRMAGRSMRATLCADCAKLTGHARAKQRRRKAEAA